MRRVWLLLCAALFAVSTMPAIAGGGDGEDEKGDPEELRRSQFNMGSYPGGPASKYPLATGYYVTDNDGPNSGAPWQPSYEAFDTTQNPDAWHRIQSGPNQGITVTQFGHEYFRNPNNMTDSTNDAFAGPISIGFPFYYYGTRYDSFYVSTNGLVALSNRRYIYDRSGNRVDYDPESDDPRGRSGNPVTDPVADDYGYRYVALNNSSARDAGILNPNNTALPNANLKSTLVPLWDECELSQVDPVTGLPDDFGRVYWRLDQQFNKLIVYYANYSMLGGSIKNIPPLPNPSRVAARQINANFQVVLNRQDSSVQYNYVRFYGAFSDPQQGIFTIPSAAMFRANSTIGVQSNDMEYTNYLYNAGYQGSVYVNGDPGTTPRTGLAIQFKQWKNVMRVLNVTFQSPNPRNPSEFVDQGSSNNFELLLGHPVLGVMRPVGIVENVSSDAGEVNVTPQPIQVGVIFRIRDLVNTTNPPVYQKTEQTKLLYPIAIAPGTPNSNANRPNIDTIVFDAYVTNPQITRQLGRFRAEIIATDRNPINGANYGERWPFDDTTGITLFGIRRVELPYITTFNNYSVSEEGVIPDVTRWVSVGAEVVDGESAVHNPPPPRGTFGPRSLRSPVAKLDRRDIGGAYYNLDIPGITGGDTLISFPVNLSTAQQNPNIYISYQRAGNQQYDRGWSDQIRTGPEQMVYNTLKTQLFQIADYMVIEFAEPSTDEYKINNVTNSRNWHMRGFGDTENPIRWAENVAPRWAVFGGGGYSDTTGTIIIDEFDPGKDFVFHRAVVPIPNRWTRDLDISKLFRFRIRGVMKSDKNPVGPPADDEDAFFLDNIIVADPDKPEVEVTSVIVDWPYTEAPASQARAIPLAAKVSNNGTTAATAFGVAMWVENQDAPPPPGYFSYYRYKTIISLGAGSDEVVPFPSWNAQECGADIDTDTTGLKSTLTNYRITAQILPQGYDSYNANDRQYTDFALRLGPTFAYDYISNTGNPRNDVAQVSGTSGKGLNLAPPYPDPFGSQPYGPAGGSVSGTFAMQFRILTRDTIRGWMGYYGAANSSPDFVRYALYKQPAGTGLNNPPQKVAGRQDLGLLPATRRLARRGEGTPVNPLPGDNGPFYYDQYVIYELDTPYVADPGVYFATVSQLGQTGLEIGGSNYRQGQVTTIHDGPGLGAGSFFVPAHPEMRQQRFWYETTAESGTWNPMLTTIGNPGFPHLNIIGNLAGFNTWQRGSWVPMIRPYFGSKASTSCEVLPVELASFEATALTSAIKLDWTTATELDNRGFAVERRARGEESWNDLAFVEGAGTSNTAKDYSYVDGDVVGEVTYQYRLRQEDYDGSTSYSSIREARISAATTGLAMAELKQNTPNPVSSYTDIPFTVAQSGTVTIEISDVYGNVVRTMSVDAAGATEQSVRWDLTDESGDRVANGTYVYKLIGSDFTKSRKMTVIR